MDKKVYSFDVAISYAGEDRAVAEAIAHTLMKRGVKVLYDPIEIINLFIKYEGRLWIN